MRIAVLFDSDHEKYDGFYGDPIRNTILSSKVIQESGRHVKVKVGDVVLSFSLIRKQCGNHILLSNQV